MWFYFVNFNFFIVIEIVSKKIEMQNWTLFAFALYGSRLLAASSKLIHRLGGPQEGFADEEEHFPRQKPVCFMQS